MNWVLTKLGEAYDVRDGTHDSPKYQETGFPLVTSKNLKEGEVNLERIKYISADDYSKINERSAVHIGDVLFAMIGTIGNPTVIVEEPNFAIKNVALFKVGKTNSSRFLKYYLETPFVIEKMDKEAKGTTQRFVGLNYLRAFPIALPPLPEQKRIVAILDQAFADIDKARALTEQNLKNARELFESYLQQVFSQPGEGWRSAELFDHVKFIDYRGKTPTKTETGLRLITAKNVRMGFLKEYPMEFVAPESYDEWMTRGIPEKGDVLFTTEAPLANVAQLDTDEKVVFAQRIITIQPDRKVLGDSFLKYMLMSAPIQKKIHEKGTGATATGIKASLLKKIPIEFPSSLNKQNLLVKNLDDLYEYSEILEGKYQQKLAFLVELKKSILQKAFSGELTKGSEVAA